MRPTSSLGQNLLTVSIIVTLLAMLLASPPARRQPVRRAASPQDTGNQDEEPDRGCNANTCPRQILLKIRGRVTPELLNDIRESTKQALAILHLDDEVSAEEVGTSGLILVRTARTEVETLLAVFTLRFAATEARMLPDVIEAFEPDPLIRGEAVPDDPSFPNQWGLNNTGQIFLPCQSGIDPVLGLPTAHVSAIPAWDCSTGSTDNVVAVLDTGIDYMHPDLADNIWTADIPYVVRHRGQDITCPAGRHGYNVLGDTGDPKNDPCNPMDDHNHGTHVAGIIGAKGNNRTGVVGVNWKAGIMAVKFLNKNNIGCVSGAIAAIDFVIAVKEQLGRYANVRVLNNSYGFPDIESCRSTFLQSAVERADSQNLLFVAGAGNQKTSMRFYPAAYPVRNVIAVAATDHLDNRWCRSNYSHDWVHLGAPGSQIYSTKLNGGYGFEDGTSMAAPFVSGAAALILSRCNSLDVLGLKNQIINNVDPIPALSTITISGGRLNVDKALRDCGRCEPRLDER